MNEKLKPAISHERFLSIYVRHEQDLSAFLKIKHRNLSYPFLRALHVRKPIACDTNPILPMSLWPACKQASLSMNVSDAIQCQLHGCSLPKGKASSLACGWILKQSSYLPCRESRCTTFISLFQVVRPDFLGMSPVGNALVARKLDKVAGSRTFL